MDAKVEIDGRKLNLTNLDKIYWPKEGYTKNDLIQYYGEVADLILPYLVDRPESMHRHPNGIAAGGSFYQKDVKEMTPDWVKKFRFFSEAHEGEINFLVCNDKATLIYMANLGCIEINPWNSRVGRPQHPDYIVLDLDPEDIPFSAVVQVALTAHGILDSLGVTHRPKTSGATGLHIYIPLAAKYDYETAKNFANILATLIHNKEPKISSLERSPAKRQKKVYVDYLQNNLGQTLASCYSVRPQEGATVSMPLTWKELENGAKPSDFTIKTVPELIKNDKSDFQAVLGKGVQIEEVINVLDH